jgi:hypothetical protein
MVSASSLADVLLQRWGSKLVNDGDITFYQFMVAFMGVFFSGMSASALFGFTSSKSGC